MAPVVQKLGIRKSLSILGGIGCIVYILGVLSGVNGTWILGCSGIFISIIYPTIVLYLQEFFPKESVATATGLVISCGTIFDIAFNALFGTVVELVGFGICKIIFPVAMVLFYLGLQLCRSERK
jgi:fucose permease